MSSKLIINTLVCAVLSLMIASCGNNSVFISKVKEISSPTTAIEPAMEKIASDEIYSQFFAVYDTLLISSNPNSPDCFFYVADLKQNKLIGSFMKKGQGPDEYLGLAPIRRIERKGDDICALTFEPMRKELLEWNISQSIKTGRDSVVSLGYYEEPEDLFSLTYNGIYMIGPREYIGYIPGYYLENKGIESLPKYWILKGENPVPEEGLTFVDRFIDNDKSMVPPHNFYASIWSIKPDNSRIVNAMQWLQQINMIDIETGNTSCYRVKGSPGEGIFKTGMENALVQYHDIVCDNSSIYALYLGMKGSEYGEGNGNHFIHQFDWDGNFIANYLLSAPVASLWLDPSSDILYGYDPWNDDLYRIKHIK